MGDSNKEGLLEGVDLSRTTVDAQGIPRGKWLGVFLAFVPQQDGAWEETE